jgi:hypothetical protein
MRRNVPGVPDGGGSAERSEMSNTLEGFRIALASGTVVIKEDSLCH